MEIRKLLPGELPPMDLLLSADPSEALVKNYLAIGECYLAVHGGDVAGVYVLLPAKPYTAELVNVAVAAEYQGKGIGKQLVLQAIETARQAGYKSIELGTGNSSVGQLALYQKCGFRIVGVDFDFFTRHYNEPIYENGILCRDMLRLSQSLQESN